MIFQQTWWIFIPLAFLLLFILLKTIPLFWPKMFIFIIGEIYVDVMILKHLFPGQFLRIDGSGITIKTLEWKGMITKHYTWISIRKIHYEPGGRVYLYFHLRSNDFACFSFADYLFYLLWINGSLWIPLFSSSPICIFKDICKENKTLLVKANISNYP